LTFFVGFFLESCLTSTAARWDKKNFMEKTKYYP
jgi:hypothetical protein